MLRTLLVALLALPLGVAIAPAVASANPAGVVPAPDAPNGGEVQLSAEYEYEMDSSHITREHAGTATSVFDPLPVSRDLDYKSSRHTLTPKLELGVYDDVWISVGMPIIIAESSQLDLAPNVTRATSSTFTDGLLTGSGFDARDPGTSPPGSTVFRDVNRAGIPELRLGLGWAPMNQARDPSKPTWKLGAEVHLAVGKVMRFDAADPSSQTGVSTGVDELKLYTSMDRRFSYFEGWFEAFYQRPIAERDSSLYKDPGFGATNIDPGQQAGAAFGLEAYIVNDKQTGNQVSIDLGARLNAHFEGRGYTELWQLFALAGNARTGGPLVLDSDPTTAGVQAENYPGISNYESYLETAARLAIRAKLGRHVSFAALGELAWKTNHVISFADAGTDLPTCGPGVPSNKCEVDNNNLINAGTREVNPLYVDKIDSVGHRYLAQDSLSIIIGVEASLLF